MTIITPTSVGAVPKAWSARNPNGRRIAAFSAAARGAGMRWSARVSGGNNPRPSTSRPDVRNAPTASGKGMPGRAVTSSAMPGVLQVTRMGMRVRRLRMIPVRPASSACAHSHDIA